MHPDNLLKIKKTIQHKILISTSNSNLDAKQQLQDFNDSNDLMRLPLDVLRKSASFFNDADVFALKNDVACVIKSSTICHI